MSISTNANSEAHNKFNSPREVAKHASQTEMGGNQMSKSPQGQAHAMREIVVKDLPQVMTQVMTYQMPTPRKTSTAALKIRKSFKKL